MAKLLLTLSIGFYSLQIFGQNPDLFKTWYLTEYILDPGVHFYVEDIVPRISPTLTFEESLTYHGEGACNSFNGTLSYDSSINIFQILSFERTLEDCGYQSHTHFEDQDYFLMFEFLDSFIPTITNENDGTQTLYFQSTVISSVELYFSNAPLDISEYIKLSTSPYPNPTLEKLHIGTGNIQIEELNIYNISGQKISEQRNTDNSMDVSSLPKGIYFLEVLAREGNAIHKFIKE